MLLQCQKISKVCPRFYLLSIIALIMLLDICNFFINDFDTEQGFQLESLGTNNNLHCVL